MPRIRHSKTIPCNFGPANFLAMANFFTKKFLCNKISAKKKKEYLVQCNAFDMHKSREREREREKRELSIKTCSHEESLPQHRSLVLSRAWDIYVPTKPH